MRLIFHGIKWFGLMWCPGKDGASLFTDRIRWMGEGNVFSLSIGGGGGRGGTYPKVPTPIQVRVGRGRRGYPKVPTPRG